MSDYTLFMDSRVSWLWIEMVPGRQLKMGKSILFLYLDVLSPKPLQKFSVLLNVLPSKITFFIICINKATCFGHSDGPITRHEKYTYLNHNYVCSLNIINLRAYKYYNQMVVVFVNVRLIFRGYRAAYIVI